MNFKDYYSNLTNEQKTILAEKSKISLGYLYLIGTGRRNAGLETAKKLLLADPSIKLSMFGLG